MARRAPYTTSLAQRLRRRQLAVTAVGGDRWRITQLSGAGISAAKTETTLGTLTGLVAQTRVEAQTTTAGGDAALIAPWRLHWQSGRVPVAGDILASSADGAVRFRVVGPIRSTLDPMYGLERL